MLAGRSGVDPSKVAAYIRWSTEEQGQGTTLEIQRERVELFVRSQGWQWSPDLVFVDDGYSGASLDRPAMGRLREAVQSGRVEGVVVYRLDRLSRSLLDTVNLVRREWQGRCVLVSATEHFDTHSPVGQMVFNILVSFAEFERNLIRERTMSGKRKRAEQGRNAGQRYPFGYRRGPDGAWEVDHADAHSGVMAGPAAVVQLIYRAYLEGSGIGRIARLLNDQAIPSPQGAVWRPPAVGRILANPSYAGIYRYGLQGGGRSLSARAAVEVPAAIPPVVTPAEFEAVQERRLGRRRPERAEAGRYLLSGLAKCGRCGNPLAGSRGKTRRYYVCTGRTLLGCCDCASIDAEGLEQILLESVRSAVRPLCARLEGARVNVASRVEACRHGLKRAEVALAQGARRRRRLEDEFLGGRIDSDTFRSLSGRLEREAVEAGERLERASLAFREAEAEPTGTGVVRSPADPLGHLQFDELRQVLRELTASLTVYQPGHRPGSKYGNPHPIQAQWQPRTG